MLQTHNRRSKIHYSQFFINHFLNADGIVFFCIRILCRIAVVYTVNRFCQQNTVCIHLNRPQGNSCVCGEVRMSGASCKKYYFLVFEARIGPILREQLRHGAAGKWCENMGLHSGIAENLRHINTVHNRSQHPNLIGFCPLNRIAGTSAPEISAANYNTYLYACIHRQLNLSGNFLYRILIKSGFFRSGQSLAA